jgi:hypothetical protein
LTSQNYVTAAPESLELDLMEDFALYCQAEQVPLPHEKRDQPCFYEAIFTCFSPQIVQRSHYLHY